MLLPPARYPIGGGPRNAAAGKLKVRMVQRSQTESHGCEQIEKYPSSSLWPFCYTPGIPNASRPDLVKPQPIPAKSPEHEKKVIQRTLEGISSCPDEHSGRTSR